MTSRWPIYSRLIASAGVIAVSAAFPAIAGSVSGKVELRDSRNPEVKNRRNYSDVVIALKPLNTDFQAPAAKATITQKDKTFSPHVLAITVGTVVDFPNFDPIFHNAFSSYSGQVFDIGLYPPGTTRSVRFSREGVVRVFCNIHASMSAMIVVLSTPYFAKTHADGSYEIPAVPEGDYEMSVFHERASASALEALRKRISISKEGAILAPIAISEAGYLSIPHKNKYGQEYPDADEHTMYPSPVK